MSVKRQTKIPAQQRQDARRQTKERVIQVADLAHQIFQVTEPNAKDASRDPHWRKQLYQDLRDIFKDLVHDENSRQAMLRLDAQLGATVDRLQASLVRLGTQPLRTVDESKPTSASISLDDDVIQLIGTTGLARTEAIDRALKARDISLANARDILRKAASLPDESRWVEPLMREGKEIKYHTGRRGPAMGLWVLTAQGRKRYRTLSGREPVESELVEAMRQPGNSLDHALGIIELAEVLEKLGCAIDRKPEKIRVDPTSTGNIHHESHIVPDLVLRAAPSGLIPGLNPVRGVIVEYEMNGKAAGSHGEQWAKRGERLGVCIIVLPNPEQQENMRYELARARNHSGFTLTAYLSNLVDLLKGQVEWQEIVFA
jgi:hypothetical protein